MTNYRDLKKQIEEIVVDDPDWNDNEMWEDLAKPFDDLISQITFDFMDVIEEAYEEKKITEVSRDGMLEHIKDKFSEPIICWNFSTPAYLA